MPRRSAPAGYTNISANYRLQTEGLWPAQIHDVKAAIRWTRANAAIVSASTPNRIVVAGYSAGGMLSLMAAGTNGTKEFEGDGGNAGVSSDVNASIGVYPLASAQIATGLFDAGAGDAREHRGGVTHLLHQPRRSRRRSSFTARTTARFQCSRASTSGRKLHALGVPAALTLIQGADHAFDNGALDAVEVMAPVDRSVSGSAARQSEALSFVRRWRRRWSRTRRTRRTWA